MHKAHSLVMFCVCIYIQLIQKDENRTPSEEEIREKVWGEYRNRVIMPILILMNICRVLVTVNDSKINDCLEYGLVINEGLLGTKGNNIMTPSKLEKDINISKSMFDKVMKILDSMGSTKFPCLLRLNNENLFIMKMILYTLADLECWVKTTTTTSTTSSSNKSKIQYYFNHPVTSTIIRESGTYVSPESNINEVDDEQILEPTSKEFDITDRKHVTNFYKDLFAEHEKKTQSKLNDLVMEFNNEFMRLNNLHNTSINEEVKKAYDTASQDYSIKLKHIYDEGENKLKIIQQNYECTITNIKSQILEDKEKSESIISYYYQECLNILYPASIPRVGYHPTGGMILCPAATQIFYGPT